MGWPARQRLMGMRRDSSCRASWGSSPNSEGAAARSAGGRSSAAKDSSSAYGAASGAMGTKTARRARGPFFAPGLTTAVGSRWSYTAYSAGCSVTVASKGTLPPAGKGGSFHFEVMRATQELKSGLMLGENGLPAPLPDGAPLAAP